MIVLLEARRRLSRPAVVATVLVVLGCATAVARESETLVGLDGKSIEGQITAIDADGNISVAGASRTVKLNALRRIDRPGSELANEDIDPSRVVFVTLASGGQLVSNGILLEDDRFGLTTLAGRLSLSIDDVRALRFGEGPVHPTFAKALKRPDDEYDRFLTEVGEGMMTSIRGFIESIDAAKVTFERDGSSQTLARAKAYAVVLASIESDSEGEAACEVGLHDGSQLRGEVQGLAKNGDGKLELSLDIGNTKLALPWEAVGYLSIRSDRVQYLSKLEPVDVLEQPIVALPRGWKRNKNVLGKPLKIGEKSYVNGIGVQSRSVLTFDAQGKYQRFTATIGIDASTQGRGDCEFVVMGDGRQLLRQRMKAADGARSISVPIADLDRVQLIVEPGADLDFGDHANWCDACFVR